MNTQYYINQALAGLSLGDYPYAERTASQALLQEPANPTALLIMGGVYQRTGRLQQAINAYQAAATVPSGNRVVNGDLWGVEGMAPVQSVAIHSLTSLNGGKMPSQTTMGPSPELGKGANYNQADRFKVLRALRQNNLISPEEFEQRDGSKIPASMNGPVPSYEEVSDRLAQITAAYATRNMTAGQHAAEREQILNSLVPKKPAPAVLEPQDPAAIAKKADEDAAKAKAAEEAAKAKAEEEAKAAATPKVASGDGVAPNPAATLLTGREPVRVIPFEPDATPATLPDANVAIHLASFRSRDAALRGWEMLKKKFPELAGLQPQISTLTLPEQGTFFRLNAGPIPSVDEAKTLCGRLKDQFCEAVFMGG
jgi:tetratricopeptide (TPR) repeat protein